MRIAVLGAGAIGAYVGAALARGGADVSLIARGAQLAALRERRRDACSARAATSTRTRPPPTTPPRSARSTSSSSASRPTPTPPSAALLAPLLHERTAVVAAQNGVPWWYFHRHGGPFDGRRIEAVDPGGATSAAIAPERAIGCVVYCSTELEAPGVVRHGEGTRFSLGEPDRSVSERCLELSAALVAGGLKAPVEPDLRDEIWVKLLGNAVFNPLSVLTRATLGGHVPPPGHARARARGHGGVPRDRERPRLAPARSRSSGASTAPSASASTAPRRCRISRRASGSSSTRCVVAVVELAELTGTPAPTLRNLAAAEHAAGREPRLVVGDPSAPNHCSPLPEPGSWRARPRSQPPLAPRGAS